MEPFQTVGLLIVFLCIYESLSLKVTLELNLNRYLYLISVKIGMLIIKILVQFFYESLTL